MQESMPFGLAKPGSSRSRIAKAAPHLEQPSEMDLELPMLSQDVLDIDSKSRSNPLTWKGQFSPQLVEAHLRQYARSGDRILDPFAGSGTVLLESLRHGAIPIGVEINPAAVILARLYAVAGFAQDVREKAIAKVESALTTRRRHSHVMGPMFASNAEDPSAEVVGLLDSFERPSLELDLMEALVVSADIYNKPDWGVIGKRWREVQALVRSLPFVSRPPEIYHADARNLPIPDCSIDLALTSPPYINVFNYHQQYRASTEAIGWNVLPIARSEIGSNRKFRGNRFLTVAQYCLDMAACLREVSRVLKSAGRAIFVVGRESNVRKTAFYNGNILAALAERAVGMRIVLKQERVFQNRFGEDIYEEILHLKLSASMNSERASRSIAETIAGEVLSEARERVMDPGILVELEDAITKAPAVEPSPMLCQDEHSRKASVLHSATPCSGQ